MSEQTSQRLAKAIQEIFRDKENHEEVAKAAAEHVYTPWVKVVERSMERYKIVKESYDEKRRAKKSKKKTTRTAVI